MRFSSRARLPELIPVISRSHRDDRQEPLMGSLGVAQGLARGSVGGKVGAILRGETDLYVSLSGRTSPKDWDIAAPEAVLLAAGGAFTQAFFSIGTGIGCILAYSAYLSRRAHLPREAVEVVGMDTAVGLLAGMVTFPVVMSFGLQDVISGSTLGTIFIALPTGLGSLGATGQLVAVLFFALALIAAITSAVSLLEVPVACLIDRLGWSRSRAVWLSTALIFVAGLPASTSMEVLGWMDSVFGGLMLILGGLLLALLLGWVLPARFQKELSHSGSPIWLQRFLLVMLRWISPPVITVGLVISVIDLIHR
ncbi:sodium-dependent transporter [Synechococcus sp. ROS8604]|nr:sodium-dependent transporter [Synechococcus sp. ROS8604]